MRRPENEPQHKTIKLTTRLVLVIGLMIAPLLMMAFGGYYLYQQTQHAFDEAAQKTLNELIPLAELQSILLQVQMPPNDYLILGNKDQIANYDELSARVNQAFVVAIDAPFEPDQIEQINGTLALWSEIDSLARQIFVTENPIGNADAAAKKEHMDVLVNHSVKQIRDNYEYTRLNIIKERERAQNRARQFNIGGVILFVGTLIFAIASTLLLRRSITQPIRQLEAGAMRLGQGELEHRINLYRDDELGQLAKHFNLMAGQLEQDRRREIARTEELHRESARHKKTANQMKRFRQAIEKTDDYIIFTDENGRIEYANSAVETATGFCQDELIGQKISIFNSGYHDQLFYQNMWHTIESGQSFRDVFANRKKDGNLFYEDKTITSVMDENGQRHYVATGRDITVQMETHDRMHYLAHLAHHDMLTGLGNRIMMMDRMEQVLAQADRNKTMVGVLFLDLDHFKNINDSLGHNNGDELLKEISRRLLNVARKGDFVTRFGGDEFVIVADGVNHIEDVTALVQRVIHAVSKKIIIKEHELYVTTSIGITVYPNDYEDADGLLKHADAAMYRAKEAGRNVYRFYSLDMTETANARIKLESELRNALQCDQFFLHYQPKVNQNTGQVAGLEALLRWRTTEGRIVPPNDFIQILEETGLIFAVGEWVLKTACRFTQHLKEAGFGDLSMAVNLSAKQFTKGDLVETVAKTLQEFSIESGQLELEITESLLVENITDVATTLSRLNDLGVSIAIDDFGTGYSSLSYLKRLPIDTIKIDRSFVTDVTVDEENDAIVNAIISLANSLGLEVVAEGVETECQRAFLAQQGCHLVQGYLYSRPLPEEGILAWLTNNQLENESPCVIPHEKRSAQK